MSTLRSTWVPNSYFSKLTLSNETKSGLASEKQV